MRSKVKRYRLRDRHRIIGYAEDTKEGMIYNVKKHRLSLSNELKFDFVDEAIGVLDKLNRMIYEYDIVSYKINHRQMRREGVVLWSEEKEAFGIYDVESRHFTFFFVGEIFLFSQDKVEIVSHAFNRPELVKRFKL